MNARVPVVDEVVDLPTFAQIEPMPSCNLQCRMCAVSQRPGGTDISHGALSLERFVAWLDQLPQLTELQLQGLGEPLLNPHFFDMVEIAVARGIRVTSNSNLTLLTPARARRCVASGLAQLNVSIDGATRATYETIRVGASFPKLLRNLDRIASARRNADANPALRLVMVLMRWNLDEVPLLVTLAADHGVAEVLLQRLAHPLDEPTLPKRYIPVRDYVRDAQLTSRDFPRAELKFAEARAIAAERGVVLHLPRLAERTDHATRGCRWPWDGLYLAADGAMMPCCMVGTPDRANFGSVEEVPIAAVWNGLKARSFRVALAGEAPPSVCQSCALYHGEF